MALVLHMFYVYDIVYKNHISDHSIPYIRLVAYVYMTAQLTTYLYGHLSIGRSGLQPLTGRCRRSH